MTKKNQTKERESYECLEQIIGCKWSVSVLMTIQDGINRPGAIERHIEGISTKVLSERLKKLTNYSVLNKQQFKELPPRTEYTLTEKGGKLVAIIKQIHALDQ